MYNSTLSLTSALDGSEWSNPREGRFTPGKDSVPLHRRLRLDGCGKSRPPMGFDPRTVHPVASLHPGPHVHLIYLFSAVGHPQSSTFFINRIYFRFM